MLGGFNPTGNYVWEIVDPFPYGIGIFDLTDLLWKTGFNATGIPYVQSSLVQDFYSKNPAYPVCDNDSIAALFPSTSSVAPTTELPSTATSSSAGHSTHTPVGAIVSGVIGGLADGRFSHHHRINLSFPLPVDKKERVSSYRIR